MSNPITASQARVSLYRLIDGVSKSHRPVLISGKRNSAVLVSLQDWESIQETLYLLSIPGMQESIRKGRAEPIAGSHPRVARRARRF
jgi:antitoxin YefM